MSASLNALSSSDVIVITSASRGIGFMTVVTASERGGKLVLAPRDGATLTETIKCVPRFADSHH